MRTRRLAKSILFLIAFFGVDGTVAQPRLCRWEYGVGRDSPCRQCRDAIRKMAETPPIPDRGMFCTYERNRP